MAFPGHGAGSADLSHLVPDPYLRALASLQAAAADIAEYEQDRVISAVAQELSSVIRYLQTEIEGAPQQAIEDAADDDGDHW